MSKELEFNVIYNDNEKELKDIVIELLLKTLKNEQHGWQ